MNKTTHKYNVNFFRMEFLRNTEIEIKKASVKLIDLFKMEFEKKIF